MRIAKLKRECLNEAGLAIFLFDRVYKNLNSEHLKFREVDDLFIADSRKRADEYVRMVSETTDVNQLTTIFNALRHMTARFRDFFFLTWVGSEKEQGSR